MDVRIPRTLWKPCIPKEEYSFQEGCYSSCSGLFYRDCTLAQYKK